MPTTPVLTTHAAPADGFVTSLCRMLGICT